MDTTSQIQEDLRQMLQQQRPVIQRYRFYRISDKDLVTAYAESVSATGMVIEDYDYIINQCCRIGKWLRSAEKPGLLLYGDPGNGKTTLLDAIMQCYKKQYQQMEYKQPASYGLVGIKAKMLEDMYTAVSDTKSRDSSKAYNTLSYMKKYAPIVMMDELGDEQPIVNLYNSIIIRPFIEYLSEWYDKKGKQLMILSSNLTDEELITRYGDRIWDRMKQKFDMINFDHSSFRK